MSSEKSRRATHRIDYKLYSETGRKVIKESKQLERITAGFKNLSAMASRKLIDDERKVCLKFERFMEEFEFELLFDVEDIVAAIVECRKLLESYDDVHLDLQRELEDEWCGHIWVLNRRFVSLPSQQTEILSFSNLTVNYGRFIFIELNRS